MNEHTTRTEDSGYGTLFEEQKSRLPGAGTWVAELRAEALDRFQSKGLPTPRLEAWKYTNLRPLARAAFAPAADSDAIAAQAEGLVPAVANALKMVFVNGHFRPDLSEKIDIRGLRVSSLADLLAMGDHALKAALAVGEDTAALTALNTAFMSDGAVIELDPETVLDRPLHLVFVGDGPAREATALHTRNLLRLADGAGATVIESYIGAPGETTYWTNSVTRIDLGKGARLEHLKLQRESDAAFHVARTEATLGEKSAYRNFALSTGGEIARNEIHVRLEGEATRLDLNGAYLGRGRQHLDNTTVIDHLKPAGYTNEVYKGVLDDESTGVFQGRIMVHPDAQKTEAHQLNRNILISDKSHVDTKPELLIFADDVKCSHGATVGDLETDSLFYLQSRGIEKEKARALLVAGFIAELVDSIEAPAARDHAADLVAAWLGTTRDGADQ
ncbi:MAG: Fe-S cluster assembly protein SufD [Alphaproteobacteria bacterium]